MKDFPIFTTEYGVASLFLKEVPYRKTAYIRIQSVQPGQTEQLLKECVDFCRVVGAEQIFAGGHGDLERYPLHAAVWEMRTVVQTDPERVENLFPVTEETVGSWRRIVNDRMQRVDNAATLEKADEKRILSSGGAYFIHRNGSLLGVGWLEDDRLAVIASLVPGMGERVLHSILSLREGETVTLEVASTNEPALRLYEKNGFLKTGEISRWFKVL